MKVIERFLQMHEQPVDMATRYETAAHVVARLRERVHAAGAELLLVHLPSGNSTLKWIEDDLVEGRAILDYLRRHPLLEGLPMYDVAEDFARLSREELGRAYLSDRHHMTAWGNAQVARLLDDWVAAF